MLIAQTKQFLSQFPDVKKLYDQAVTNYESKLLQRNVLDDLRLALELLLRRVLGNTKTLENQVLILGKMNKTKGGSQEVINMFQKIVDYYSNYNNTYVKHNDNVNGEEIGFIINLTTTIMLYVIKNTEQFRNR